MIKEVKGIIKKIFNKQYRGANNFEIAPILLTRENKDYYLEAIGMYAGIPQNFQEGNPVRCKIDLRSQQSRSDEEKYWTNVNLVDCELDIDQPDVESFENSNDSLDPQKDDLPF